MTSRADEDQLQRASLVISQLRRKLSEFQHAASEPVAIIGMACRFPGAPDCDSFWRMIEAGQYAATATDATRLAGTASAHEVAKPAALLPDIATFDPAFFDISPREALQMDPQQRLFLEVAWEALEDAGQTRERLAGSDTATFVGVHNLSSGYIDLLKTKPSAFNELSGVGSGHDVIAGRLAYFLDLHGPTAAVNTACSSSLVAFHLACQNVLAGDCRMAVVGGVNLILGWADAIASFAGMLAADGRCKTYDARADGFGRGEGCGVVILKRLSHAIADRDRVLAVVRATAVNQDGRTNGLTAPSGLAQQLLLRRALEKSGLHAGDITYVEAHGTGTALGDPIEVEAIAEVYGTPSESSLPCALGSAKANVNHLEGAAGVAGIIKTVLALRERTIPPVAGFERLNPHVSLDGTRLFIPTAAMPWESSGKPRVATVSSFGWSGANAHVILQDHDAAELRVEAALPVRPVLALVSTSDPRSLPERLSALAHTLDALPDDALEHFAWTTSRRRSHYRSRFAAIAADRASLLAALQAGAQGSHAEGADAPPVIGLLFGDSDDALASMAEELRADEPAFAAAAEACDASFAAAYRAGDALAHKRAAAMSAQVGIAALLNAWGVRSSVSAGFGVGAVVARYIDGEITLDAAVADVLANRTVTQLEPEIALAQLRSAGATAIVPIAARIPSGAGVIQASAPASGERYGARLWLLDVLARLYRAGADLAADALFAPGATLISLPAYPFRRRRFWITDDAGAPQPAGAVTAAAPDAWFFETVWRQTEPARESPVELPFAKWLLIADRSGFADQCARVLDARGEQFDIVRPGEDVFYRAGAPSGRIAVVDLRALDAAGEESAADAVMLASSVVDLERETAAPDAASATLFVVTRGAQAPLPFEPPASLGAAGLWGLCRSLRLERPDGWGGLIDLDPVASPLDAERLVRTIASLPQGAEPEIALRGDDRHVPRLESAIAPARAAVLFKSDATYLVTGASGVLGTALAAWLADCGAKHLVLLARSLPADDRVARALRARGVTVHVVACDLGAPGTLDALAAVFGNDRPPLRGIFHLAGATRATETITAGDLAAAFQAKFAGALALDAFSAEMDLDYFVCFSSAAAVLGERSRAPYAAANACLDAFIAERRARNLPGLSVNWGLWAGRDADDAAVRFFVRSGLTAMPLESGLDALGRLLGDNGAGRVNWHPLVAALDMPRLRAALETRRPAAILRAFDARAQTAGTGGVPPAVEQLHVLDARTQEARVAEIIGAEACAVLELAADDRLDVERGFFDLGMDSLMSVDLKSRVEIAFGLSLPSTITMDYPSVTALSAYVRDALFGSMPAQPGVALTALGGDSAADADDEAQLAGLDDEAVARALDAELRALDLELLS
jgi:acyl transferase domain-containing protein/acyl carrier protein